MILPTMYVPELLNPLFEEAGQHQGLQHRSSASLLSVSSSPCPTLPFPILEDSLHLSPALSGRWEGCLPLRRDKAGPLPSCPSCGLLEVLNCTHTAQCPVLSPLGPLAHSSQSTAHYWFISTVNTSLPTALRLCQSCATVDRSVQ